MTWFKVCDGLSFHTKAVEAGNAAMGAWVRMGSYSSWKELDGRVPKKIAETIGKAAEVQALLRVVLLERLEDGDYLLHDYTDYNPTRAELERHRGRWAGKKKRQRGESTTVSPGDTPRDTTENPPKTPSGSPGSGSGSDPDPEGSAEGRAVESVREVACRAYGEGIRSVIDGPPFTILDDEADVIVRVISDSVGWSALRGHALAQRIRKSAADYVRAKRDKAEYERGFSPTKWAEWLRSGGEAPKVSSSPAHVDDTDPATVARIRRGPKRMAFDDPRVAAVLAPIGAPAALEARQPLTQDEVRAKAEWDKQRLAEADRKAGTG